MSWRRFVFLSLLSGLLSACGPTGFPERVVEDYLLAVVSGDEVRSANFSCADWEAQARTDALSFTNVEAGIEGLSCQTQGENEGTVVIACQGTILANYEGEVQEIQLSDRRYRVVVDGGEWRVCGYP
ncbi:MAG: hypothetical protein GTO14_02910 [Anaerolineales bacterium]|nr:hypothetical protein [Anaerolineales bacterium]